MSSIELFSIDCRKNQIQINRNSRKVCVIISQWALEVMKGNMAKAREKRVTKQSLVFVWRLIGLEHGPITDQSKANPEYFWNSIENCSI